MEKIRVTSCAGLGWIALWLFFILLKIWEANSHLSCIAEKLHQSVKQQERLIAAVDRIIEDANDKLK